MKVRSFESVLLLCFCNVLYIWSARVIPAYRVYRLYDTHVIVCCIYRLARLQGQQKNCSVWQDSNATLNSSTFTMIVGKVLLRYYTARNGSKQPWCHFTKLVKTAIKSFHIKQKWQNNFCSVCYKLWPTRASVSTESYVCASKALFCGQWQAPWLCITLSPE